MGLSYAELADACEIAPGSVGKLLSRAARDFARAYERAGG
jgi:DNA-directed RNA polymerase specialized sigma24 family protein